MVTQNFDSLSFPFKPKEEFLDEDFRQKVVSIRERNGEGEKAVPWAEIADELNKSVAIVSLAYRIEQYGGLLPFRSESELKKKIVKERDKNEVAWGIIGARAGGLTENRTQSLYEEEKDEPYFESYIGKGGRPREDGSGFQPEKGSTGKKSSKKTTKKASKKKETESVEETEAPTLEFADDADADDVKAAVAEAIEGKTLTVARPGGKTATITVEEVVAAKQNKSGAWGVKVKSDDGKTPAFGLSKIEEIN